MINNKKALAVLETSIILVVLTPLLLATFGILIANNKHSNIKNIVRDHLQGFTAKPFTIHTGDQGYWVRIIKGLGTKVGHDDEDEDSGSERLEVFKEFVNQIQNNLLDPLESAIKETFPDCLADKCVKNYSIKLKAFMIDINQNSGAAVKTTDLSVVKLAHSDLLKLGNTTRGELKDLHTVIEETTHDFIRQAGIPFPYAIPTALINVTQDQYYGESNTQVQEGRAKYLRRAILLALQLELETADSYEGKLLNLLKTLNIYSPGSRLVVHEVFSPRVAL